VTGWGCVRTTGDDPTDQPDVDQGSHLLLNPDGRLHD